jgi:high-affinity iron transporter
MLATFVIGLREGLEAALIIGIIAAFLKQSNRQDALRKVWLGVGVAIVLCLAVGVTLQVVNASLPQRQQEMLECVVAAIAVVMVSYMVLWMRKHSRALKSDLQNAAGSALARGSAGALVAMAFLAVIREGFETAVFLLAAFQSALSPVQAAIGVVLGVAVAIGLGYLVYRGGVKLNLSKFFRFTGVVLVLVAAGLVMSTLRAAYEAGWLTAGQQTLLDLSAIARPGSVQESLLTGMLGIRSSLPVVEVIAYLLYAIPMLAVVLWPPKRTPSRRSLGGILVGTAAAALVAAGLFAALGPANPANVSGTQGPFDMQGEVNGTAQVSLSADLTSADLSSNLAGSIVTGTSALTSSGHADLAATPGGATVSATVYQGSPISAPVDAAAAGLPTTLSAAQIAALNGGRLPVGVRSGQADQAFDVSYTDTVTPTITTNTGVVLAAEFRLVRSVQVSIPDRGPVSAGTAQQATSAATPASLAAGFVQVADSVKQRSNHEVLTSVLPALLVVFALILLAFGLPKLIRRKPRPAVVAGADQPGSHERVTDLANAGVHAGNQQRQPGG